MASNGTDAFLRAEEEAQQVLDQLRRLKEEVESYRTARAALNQVAEGMSALVDRLLIVAEKLESAGDTLHSIGTAELLRAHQTLAAEVASLREELGAARQTMDRSLAETSQEIRLLDQNLCQREESRQQECASRSTELRLGLAQIMAGVRPLRSFALGAVALAALTLVLVAWVAFSLPRG